MQIADLEKSQDARRMAMAAKNQQRAALLKQGKGEKKMQDVVKGIQEEMNVDRKTTKDIMDYEGHKFEDATTAEKVAEVGLAKTELHMAADERSYSRTASLSKASELDQKMQEARAMIPVFKTKMTEQQSWAAGAVDAQHQAATELKKSLGLAIDKIIAAEIPTGSEQEQDLKGKIELTKIQEATQRQALDANKIALSEMQKDFTNAQAQRVSNEKEITNLSRLLSTLKKKMGKPADFSKGVSIPQEIEAAKASAMMKKLLKLQNQNKSLKQEELKYASQVEAYKLEGERMDDGIGSTGKQMVSQQRELKAATKAEYDRTKGPLAVLRDAKANQLKQKALAWRHTSEDKADLAKQRAEDADKIRKTYSVKNEDRQINKSKAKLSAVQDKLKALKAKISPATLAGIDSRNKKDRP